VALREILATFGFQVDDKNLQNASKRVDSVAQTIGSAFAVVAATQVFGFFKSFVGELQSTADQLIDTSAALGVNATELQRWQLAAKLSGAEATDLATGLRNISKVANDAKGSAEIKRLGIDLKDANGNAKTATQLMGDVGLEIGKLKSPTERTAKALEFFGKSGAKLMPMFAEGEEGIAKMLGRLDELGGGLGEDALAILEKSGDATDEMNVAILSLKSRLAVELFPALTRGIGTFTKFLGNVTNGAKGTRIFQAAIVVLGSVAAAAGLSAIAPWLPFIAAITAATLIVDDLIVLFEGGDSAIGRLIDNLFGAGTATEWVKDAKQWWSDLWTELDKADTVTEKIEVIFDALEPVVEEALSRVGEAIVRQVIKWGDDVTSPTNETTGVIFDGLIDGLTPLPIAMTIQAHKAFEAFKEGALSKGREIVESVKTIGSDIVRGLTEGILAVADDPVAAIGNLADKVLEKLKNVFKSKSPSKATFDIGGDDVEGLRLAFVKLGPKAVDAAGNLGQDVLGALSPRPMLEGSRMAAATRPMGGNTIRLEQRNQNDITIQAGANGSLREDVRAGVMQAHNNDRDMMLAALEPVAPMPEG
jgi:hypothetical protein